MIYDLIIIYKIQEQTQCVQVLPIIKFLQIIKYKKNGNYSIINPQKQMRNNFKQLLTF